MMTGQTDDNPGEPETEAAAPSAQDQDAGEPISELAELTVPTSPQFEARVQRRINRRLVAGEIVTAPAKVAASMMQHYVTSLVRAIHGFTHGNDRSRDR